jgi:hypothetical protein
VCIVVVGCSDKDFLFQAKLSPPLTSKRSPYPSQVCPLLMGAELHDLIRQNMLQSCQSKSSLPAANGGQSAGDTTIVSVVSPNQSKLKSNVIYSSPAANGGQSAGDTTIISVVSPNQSKSKSNVIYLKCITINWLNQVATKKEVCKYVKFDVDVSLTQEDQLEMLMEKFSLADLKSAYLVTMGKVGIEDPSEIILPNNTHKETVIFSFISLIFDHRCMMYDYTENAFQRVYVGHFFDLESYPETPSLDHLNRIHSW